MENETWEKVRERAYEQAEYEIESKRPSLYIEDHALQDLIAQRAIEDLKGREIEISGFFNYKRGDEGSLILKKYNPINDEETTGFKDSVRHSDEIKTRLKEKNISKKMIFAHSQPDEATHSSRDLKFFKKHGLSIGIVFCRGKPKATVVAQLIQEDQNSVVGMKVKNLMLEVRKTDKKPSLIQEVIDKDLKERVKQRVKLDYEECLESLDVYNKVIIKALSHGEELEWEELLERQLKS